MTAAAITNVLVAAATYDLVDLDTVKDELNITSTDTSKDDFLSRAITQVSAAVANYCNRVFPVETVKDIFDEQGFHASYGFGRYHGGYSTGASARLQLSRWPVVGGSPVTLAAPSETDAGNVLPFASTDGVTVGQPVSHLSIPVGTTVASLVTNVSVTLSVPLTAPIFAGDAVTFGLSVIRTNSYASPESAEIITSDNFRINASDGQVLWLNRHLGGYSALTTVVYQAGYQTIPADLTDAVLRAVTGRFAARGRDPLLREQNQPILGQQTYWIGTSPGQRGGFTGEIADILDTYANR